MRTILPTPLSSCIILVDMVLSVAATTIYLHSHHRTWSTSSSTRFCPAKARQPPCFAAAINMRISRCFRIQKKNRKAEHGMRKPSAHDKPGQQIQGVSSALQTNTQARAFLARYYTRFCRQRASPARGVILPHQTARQSGSPSPPVDIPHTATSPHLFNTIHTNLVAGEYFGARARFYMAMGATLPPGSIFPARSCWYALLASSSSSGTTFPDTGSVPSGRLNRRMCGSGLKQRRNSDRNEGNKSYTSSKKATELLPRGACVIRQGSMHLMSEPSPMLSPQRYFSPELTLVRAYSMYACTQKKKM